MEIISNGKKVQYDLFTGGKARSERDMWLDEIVDNINATRKNSKYPPITHGQVLGLVKRKFVYADKNTLKKVCEHCKTFSSFSKGFFYLTKK